MIVRLLRLLFLKQAAWLRHTFRSLRAPRRAIGLLAMVVLFGFFVWQNSRLPGGFSREALAVLVATLFVMHVASGLVQQGPRFTPADVDFLFPAPLSPRHLLLWRLLHLWPIAIVSAIFFAALLGSRVERPFRFFVCIALLQVITTHLQLLIAVLMTRVGDAIARRLRGVGRILAVLALLGALLYLVVAVSQQGGIAAVIAPLAEAPLTRFLFFPASACIDFVFGVTPAETWFALLRLVLAVIGTLALLLLPDIDFREDSIATTARISRLLAARRRTGAAVDMEEGVRVRGAVPAARVLFRASGAIVWKNLLLLVRSWKSVLPSLLLGLVLVLPVMFAMRDDESVEPGASAIVPIVMVTAFWSNALGFDLRRETDRLDLLRALPLSSSAIVFAELLLPWSLSVILQEGLIAALSWFGHGGRRDLGVLALVLPLITFLAVLIDNLAVFLFSSRSAGAARGTVASTSPAQLLRFVAWLIAAAPGFMTVAWLAPRYGSLLWPVVLGVAVELALAVALFALLVKWYESRELEPAE